jgi:Na+-driven multidrug efflux pump
MEKVASRFTGHIITIAIVVVALTVISLVAGRAVGKNDKRKRRQVVNLTFYGGMILFAFVFLPQLIGARG